MLEIDFYIIFFLIVFIIIFLLDYYILLKPKLNINGKKKKNGKDKSSEIMEIKYLSSKFNINYKSLIKTWVFLWIAFINAFIITIVSSVISFLPINTLFDNVDDLEISIKLMIGFVLLFGLIYSLYELFGKYLVKKGLK